MTKTHQDDEYDNKVIKTKISQNVNLTCKIIGLYTCAQIMCHKKHDKPFENLVKLALVVQFHIS